LILRELGQGGAATYLAASAVIALPTVILAFFYGQSRIFFVMARDGLLPRSLARVSERGSPVRITLFTAAIVAILAGFIPLDELAALANAGTLTAFIAVAACMLIMRPPRAGRAAHLPDPARAPCWLGRDPRLCLPVLQPAADDPDLLLPCPAGRPGYLCSVRIPAERGGPVRVVRASESAQPGTGAPPLRFQAIVSTG
jgi:hypothetical protein